jgi:hypothetical protein
VRAVQAQHHGLVADRFEVRLRERPDDGVGAESSRATRRRRSAITSSPSSDSTLLNPAPQIERRSSPEAHATGPRNAGPSFTNDGRNAPSSAACPTGLRANAAHSTRPATRESIAAQRAATSPENDSATSTGFQSTGTWAIAFSRYASSDPSARFG